MSIKEQVEKYGVASVQYCNFQKILYKLNREDLHDYQELIDRKINSSLLAKILVAEGYSISKETIRIHINGECKCPK
jgi:hypothetical protein